MDPKLGQPGKSYKNEKISVSEREITERNKKIKDTILKLTVGPNHEEFLVEKARFIQHLTEHYWSAERYQVYKLLIGEQLSPETDVWEDFPDDDSVEKFVEGMIQKYGGDFNLAKK